MFEDSIWRFMTTLKVERRIGIPILTLVICVFLSGVSTVPASAAGMSGGFSGLFLDETGLPLDGILVSLVNTGSKAALPILARSSHGGRIHLPDLEVGSYQIQVKSSQYRSPSGRLVSILPGRTAVVTLILQQLFDFEGQTDENVGIKALLRNGERRLIFRGTDPLGEDLPSRPLFEEAAFRVYSGGGMGGDFFAFPGESWGGYTTNFAVRDQTPLGGDYLFAGQLNSGRDSLWRLRNTFSYNVGSNNILQVSMGYGRVSFGQPDLSIMDNPAILGQDLEFVSTPATSNLVTLGFEDAFRFNEALAVRLGLDLDHVDCSGRTYFVSPNAELAYQPFSRTRIQLLMTSKRRSQANSVTMPDGSEVSLAGSVLIARVGDRLEAGTARHYQVSVSQSLNDRTEVEFAAFASQLVDFGLPVLAMVDWNDSLELEQLDTALSRTEGYRMTLRRFFGDNFQAELSYVRANAPGLSPTPVGEAIAVDQETLARWVERFGYHLIAAKMDIFIPKSDTQVTALVKVVPNGDPIATLDLLNDVYDTQNEGVNLFVRQLIPLPASVLGLLGLEFLAPQRVEALLDIRNLLNGDIGSVEAPAGQVTFLRSPRSVRGGIAFRF